MRVYIDAVDAFAKAGDVLARYNPVRKDAEFQGAWTDCENAQKTLQLARREVMNHTTEHRGADAPPRTGRS
jgi:hypothetical protein